MTLARSAALAVALLAFGSAVQAADHDALPGAVRELIEQGEASLRAGDPPGAQARFERAAATFHAPEIELPLVRTYLQAGEYRRALAFAAHAAGAHLDRPEGTALYVWLLHIGGQPAIAARTLAAARRARPADATLHAVDARLAEPWPLADGALLDPPARCAPYASGAAVPPTATVTASGVLVDAGKAVLVPAAALASARSAPAPESGTGRGTRYWVRNGLGVTAAAVVERRATVAGIELAILRLAAELPLPDERLAAARAPFAGSVGYSVEYSPDADSAPPAWPLLRLGFIGRPLDDTGAPALGIALPPSRHGGPVFDAAGRLVGLAVSDDQGRARLAPVALLEPALRERAGAPSDAAPSLRMDVDLVYERALQIAVQLIVD